MITVLTNAVLRIAGALLLCAILAGAAIISPGGMASPAAVLAAQDDDDDDSDAERDDDDDSDAERDDDDDDDGDGDGGDDDGGEDDGADTRPVRLAEEPVTATEPLGIDVGCEWHEERDHSTCAFVPIAMTEPALDLLVPVQGICAEVTGGDYETDQPETGDDGEVAYYSARSGETEVVLVLAGEVSTAGSTIYWVETDAGRQPAAGLGLTCAFKTFATPEPTPSPEAAASTGWITVQAYRCDVATPPDAASFDWYGECAAPGDDLVFDLFLGDDAEPIETLRVDDAGITTFVSLDPGTYRLEESGGDWCYAESDSVDASGDVVVEAGNGATVWIFQCMDGEDVK